MKNIQQKRIGEICISVCSGGTPKSTDREYYEGNILWLTTSEVKFNRIYDTNTKITEKGLKNSSAKIIPKNCVIVAMYGVTAGNVAINKVELSTNQACCNLHINPLLADYRYIFYFLSLQSKELNLLANGSAQQNLNSILIKKYKIFFPEKKTQEKIGLLLEKYDDLIENNNRCVKLLENMAEETYKEWFVRFRFPEYKKAIFIDGIPKNWERKRLKDLLHERISNSIKKAEKYTYNNYLPIDFIPNHSMALVELDSIENAESSLQYFEENDILFGAMRPYFHKVLLAPIKGITRTTCFVLEPNNEIYREYAYLLMFQKSTVDFSTTISVGSTMPYVRWKDFNRMNVIIPPEEIIIKFNKIIKPILKKLQNYYFENKNLRIQRDFFLPRLMSGKIDLTNKEIV